MKQFVVIGLGSFGFSLAQDLAEKGFEVLAIDVDETRVQNISDIVTHAVEADATDEDVLKTLGVGDFDVAVVSIGDNIHANILATMIIKDLGVPYVISKAQNSLHGKVLKKVGADRVVFPEREMGKRIAQNLMSTNVLDYLEFAPDYRVVEIVATDNMIGKTLADLQLRSKYDINVMAIRREDEINLNPGAEDEILEDDILVVMGKNENIDKVKDL